MKLVIRKVVALLLVLGITGALAGCQRDQKQAEIPGPSEQASVESIPLLTLVPSASLIPTIRPTSKPTIVPTTTPIPTPTTKTDIKLDYAFFIEKGVWSTNFLIDTDIKRKVGGEFQVGDAQLINLGDEHLKNIEIKVVIEGKDQPIEILDGLEAGQSRGAYFKIPLPGGKGKYQVIMQVNPNKKIIEKDYSNNQGIFTYTLE